MTSPFEHPDLAYDREHLWHPYSSMTQPGNIWPVVSAEGVRLKLEDGRELIDGMSSWWCAVHGYNHPVLNAALAEQASRMSHVMFGGLTHGPAVELGRRLIELSPEGLDKVFIADSGSVSVEVAIKMAIQYQQARGETGRTRLLALERGYHGDTLGAMSLCDPTRGMHHLFSGILPKQFFVPAPQTRFDSGWDPSDILPLQQMLEENHKSIAALILEPVVQGAGGMRFYHPEYLRQARALCTDYGVLLIADEIATGFGRAGKLFACEYAEITPDIMCVGKAITGGYMTLAATLATTQVAETISEGEAGCFMHGPTFMGNPLACRVACASLDLLIENDWQTQVAQLEQGLNAGLAPARTLDGVADVRVLGGIGVIELKQPVDMATLQPACVDRGIWVRPFAHNFYVMPPFIMGAEDLAYLTRNMVEALADTL
ncbi:MAG: adenosylmethionine--8-amino-7-oxononanoate transaminase [Thalassolituus sp.]